MKAGEYVMEKQLFHFNGPEPFIYHPKHTFRMLINHQCRGIQYTPTKTFLDGQLRIICEWLLSEFRNPYAEGVSSRPFRYHLDMDRPLLVHDTPRRIGVASIIFNRIEPPIPTGEENTDQLEADARLADRVINEFFPLNNDINIEAWLNFKNTQMYRAAWLKNNNSNNNNNNNNNHNHKKKKK